MSNKVNVKMDFAEAMQTIINSLQLPPDTRVDIVSNYSGGRLSHLDITYDDPDIEDIQPQETAKPKRKSK